LRLGLRRAWRSALLRRLRPQHLLLLRMTHRRLLRLILPALLRGGTLLLLTLNCLLSGSFSLRLLLLTHHLPLVLRTSWLAHPLALSLNGRTLSCSLVRLLFAQFLHLLSRISITPRRLSCQVSHLSFARLLCRKIWLLVSLRCLTRGRCTLIRDLQLLIFHSIIQRLDP